MQIPNGYALLLEVPTDDKCLVSFTFSNKDSYLPYEFVLSTQGGRLLICYNKSGQGLSFSREIGDAQMRHFTDVVPGTAWVDAVANARGENLPARYSLIKRPDHEEEFEGALSTFDEELESSGSAPTITLSQH